MPKTLWLPGGRGGGGHRETFYTKAENDEDVEVSYNIGWNAGFAQGAAQERLHRKNDEAAAAKLSDVVGGKPEFLGGYGISRPAQNPCPKALADPVERVRWWETIDSTPCFFVTVVALILIVLVAIVMQGVAW